VALHPEKYLASSSGRCPRRAPGSSSSPPGSSRWRPGRGTRRILQPKRICSLNFRRVDIGRWSNVQYDHRLINEKRWLDKNWSHLETTIEQKKKNVWNLFQQLLQFNFSFCLSHTHTHKHTHTNTHTQTHTH